MPSFMDYAHGHTSRLLRAKNKMKWNNNNNNNKIWLLNNLFVCLFVKLLNFKTPLAKPHVHYCSCFYVTKLVSLDFKKYGLSHVNHGCM
jgi:hypothetical protein